jgi:hypothetical protein
MFFRVVWVVSSMSLPGGFKSSGLSSMSQPGIFKSFGLSSMSLPGVFKSFGPHQWTKRTLSNYNKRIMEVSRLFYFKVLVSASFSDSFYSQRSEVA